MDLSKIEVRRIYRRQLPCAYRHVLGGLDVGALCHGGKGVRVIAGAGKRARLVHGKRDPIQRPLDGRGAGEAAATAMRMSPVCTGTAAPQTTPNATLRAPPTFVRTA